MCVCVCVCAPSLGDREGESGGREILPHQVQLSVGGVSGRDGGEEEGV